MCGSATIINLYPTKKNTSSTESLTCWIMAPRKADVFCIITFVPAADCLRSRGSTGRSATRPLGWQEFESVRDSNVMTSRVALLCLLASAKACWWTLEQPQSSIMDRHPSFQRLMGLLPVRRLSMLMGDFGGHLKKQLPFGVDSWVRRLV